MGVRVTNLGKRPVTVVEVGFVAAKAHLGIFVRRAEPVVRDGLRRLRLMAEETGLPKTLKDGETAVFPFVMADLLRSDPRPDWIVVRDSEYQEHRVSVARFLSGWPRYQQIVRREHLDYPHNCSV